ncbi:MAG: alpha/beta fold hydrolase [Deltaproteobacteria bacterium]|nr:alpha/beta fold hydrolase [Deltaproteobacteria bacterium]
MTAPPRHARAADGTELLYRVAGPADAPWLVLGNGAGCSEEFWTTALVPTLAPRLRLLWWNYRGHHGSAPAADPTAYRIEHHAADLLALLDTERIASAVFLGFSLGVQVTLEAYRRRPAAFRALALVSGSDEDPLATFAGLPLLRPLLCGMFDLGVALPGLAARVMRLTLGGPLAVPFARATGFCERDVPEAPFRAYLAQAAALPAVPYVRTLRLMAEHSARDVVPQVAIPTLLVSGLEDTMTPPGVMERIRAALPDATWLPVAGGRHTLLLTRGGWVGRRVLEFLDRRGLLSGARTSSTAAPAP